MNRLLASIRSPVGQKVIMALTGVIMVGFVIGHMIGNLKIFQGAEHLNAYAEFLRTVGAPAFARGELLWIARVGLIVAVVLHINAAVRLTRLARRARPVGYAKPVHLESTYASRTMRWGGVTLTAFIVYHLLHMTTGNAHRDFIRGDVYHNMVVAFSSVPVFVAYLVAMGMLGFHLYHGIWSGLQTLGLEHPQFDRLRRVGAGVLAVVIVGGFLAGPLAILLGFIS